MKTLRIKSYIFSAIVLLTVIGCQKEEPVEPVEDPNVTSTTNSLVGFWFEGYAEETYTLQLCSSGTYRWAYWEYNSGITTEEFGTWEATSTTLTLTSGASVTTYQIGGVDASSLQLDWHYFQKTGDDPCDFPGSGGTGGGGGGGGGSGPVYGTMSDTDGNTYQTVVIGTQTWMAENMKTTKTKNGQSIPLGFTHYTDPMMPSQHDVLAMTFKNHDPNLKDVYGGLYNFYTAERICPNGWHLPTKQDWETLLAFIGNSNPEKLQKVGSWGWTTTNETGFSAVPNDIIYGMAGSSSPIFGVSANSAQWWSSYVDNVSDALGFSGYNGQGFPTYNTPVYHATTFAIDASTGSASGQRFQGEGLPCRCIQD